MYSTLQPLDAAMLRSELQHMRKENYQFKHSVYPLYAYYEQFILQT